MSLTICNTELTPSLASIQVGVYLIVWVALGTVRALSNVIGSRRSVFGSVLLASNELQVIRANAGRVLTPDAQGLLQLT